MNIIHGTNEIVSMNVRWYSCSPDSWDPKRNRNNVIEGYITIQIFNDIRSLAFAFIFLLFACVSIRSQK
jgi:hypothetical protein